MSSTSNKMPWLIVGGVGCLAVCLCVTLAIGVFILLPGTNSSGLLSQISGVASPTLAPLPSVTRAAATTAPLPSITRAPVATSAPLPTVPSAPAATVVPTKPAAVPPTLAAIGATPTPQCPSAPALAPGVLFNDDFGSQAVSDCNGWALGPGDYVDHVWAQNKYNFVINKTDYIGLDWPDGQFDNFAAEVEAQPTSDGVTDYGLAFRISGAKGARSYYIFGVTSDGRYYVQEQLNGSWVDVDPVKITTSTAVKQGKTKNTVGVIARGNSFALYINRVFVKTITDDALKGLGNVGLFAASNSTNVTVTFTRFTLLTPDKAQADWR
jgi:hypothetical protein